MYTTFIRDNFAFDGIDIFIVQKRPGERPSHILASNGEWRVIPEGGVALEPTLTLHESAARSLLDDLLQHYQGATDLHTVRGDLLNERSRVDKMLNSLIKIAETGSGSQ